MKRRARPEEKPGELNVVPYLDVIVNLVMFMLMSMTGFITFQMINVTTPDLAADASTSSTPPPEAPKEEFVLNVSISKKGFYIAATGGVLGGDTPADGQPADPNATPPTIPLTAQGEYDYEALTLKMAAIKDQKPDHSQFFLAADKSISYEVIVATMDATRGDTQRTLFPDVAFAAVSD